jgi:plastocyanin
MVTVGKKTLKESFPITFTLSLSIILAIASILLSSPWQMFSTVDAQEESNNEKEDDNGNQDINDSNDDTFSVIIPENAAWSESINKRFDPSNITIPVGIEVTWTNEDGLDHTITSGNWSSQDFDGIHDGRFYSGVLSAEDSFSYTFTEPGIYSYFCSPHPWMSGFILVQSHDVAEGEQERTDGDVIGTNTEGNDEEESNNNEYGEDPDQE